ncbi:hypothetical protein [Candidatus Enterovibrio escicola]|uniref:hypothetical protein n=1 Tax=Candidatus Enterovibrio escicola TaxID=1927127 RepID=UPI001CC25840|nr:hypothetical protein [Candidatus Enterovibrio escacola]
MHQDFGINNLDGIFVGVDDFFQTFHPAWEKHLIFLVLNKEINLTHFMIIVKMVLTKTRSINS